MEESEDETKTVKIMKKNDEEVTKKKLKTL